MFRKQPLLLLRLLALGAAARSTCRSGDEEGATCRLEGARAVTADSVLLQYASGVYEGGLQILTDVHTSETCYGELQALAEEEGGEVGKKSTRSLTECKQSCSENSECESMSFCPGWWGCWLKDKSFTGGEAYQTKADCKTYFKKPCTLPPTSAPTPAPTAAPMPSTTPMPPPAPAGAVCYGELSGLAAQEGTGVGSHGTRSEERCQEECSNSDECKSVSFCPQWNGCWLKDRTILGDEATVSKGDCKTLYKRPCDDNRLPPGPAPGPAPSGVQVKAVSYNLYWWNAFGQNPWKGEKIIENINNNLGADVLGLQECDHPGHIASRTDYLEASQFAGAQGVMAKSGLFTVGETGSRDIEATGKWGPRFATWAELTHKASGRTFWHFNTHWCVHNGNGRTCGPDKRYVGAQNMLKIIQERAGQHPVIITGDFNAAMSEAGPQHFLKNGFSLAHASRVDAVFYSTAHWKKGWARTGDAAHSDHNPVIAELELI